MSRRDHCIIHANRIDLTRPIGHKNDKIVRHRCDKDCTEEAGWQKGYGVATIAVAVAIAVSRKQLSFMTARSYRIYNGKGGGSPPLAREAHVPPADTDSLGPVTLQPTEEPKWSTDMEEPASVEAAIAAEPEQGTEVAADPEVIAEHEGRIRALETALQSTTQELHALRAEVAQIGSPPAPAPSSSSPSSGRHSIPARSPRPSASGGEGWRCPA